MTPLWLRFVWLGTGARNTEAEAGLESISQHVEVLAEL